MSYSQLATVLFLGILTAACHDNDINSDELATDNFIADIHVTNGGTGITAVEAQLRDLTTAYYIDLKNGDRLLSSTVGPVETFNINDDLFSNLAQNANQVKLMTGSFSDGSYPSGLLNFSDEVSGSLYEDDLSNNIVYTI